MGVMADKEHAGIVEAFEPYLTHLICTQNSTDRSLPAAALARAAVDYFGEDRVSVVPDLADAIDRAAALAEAGQALGESLGTGAVLVTGSVVTVGEARTMLKGRRS
jgi:dihydrofolate synthase/folylpolyglutamate synthase